MRITYKAFIAALPAFVLIGCGGGSHSAEPTPTTPPIPPEKVPEIRISPTITRATDYGFEKGDCVGLYVVNYSGSTPGTLASAGNHVDNMRFTYNGTWTPDRQISWADNNTHADFYLYYPYSNVQSTAAHTFSVNADQSTERAYKASDLMAGKALDVVPTENAVSIQVSHVLSRIVIALEAGDGFTAESLAQADIAVRINGVKCDAVLDISSGAVSATGKSTTVVPLYSDGTYNAFIVPQTVEEDNLITVTADGRDYNLRNAFTFESAKTHRFTVTLSKATDGINVSINPWLEDEEDNGGTAE